MAKPKYCSEDYDSSAGPTSQGFGILPNICSPGAGWVWPYHANTGAQALPTVSRMYLIPIFPGKPCTLTQLSYQIGTQGSGSGTQVLRAGIYNADTSTMRPSGSPLVDFGTVDLEATTGIKLWNITDQDLDPKLYWLASVKQTSGSVTTQSQIYFIGQTTFNSVYCTDTSATPATFATNILGYYQDSVTGALPSIGTLVGHQGTVPLIQLRF